MQLRAQIRVLRTEPPLLERGIQLVQQFLELERLRDEALRAEPRDLDGFADGAKPGDDDREDVRVAREGLVQHVAAVDAGQPQVGDEDVEGELVEPLEGFLARTRLFDPETLIGEPFRDDFPEAVLVVDQEEMLLRGLGHA